MLDQDTARALLTITAEAGATVALVGDRAQLPAVGRGGVLDMAAQIRGRTYDMSELHGFTHPDYAALTLRMRDRENPGEVFDRLAAMNLVTLHTDDDSAREHITANAQDGEAITVATNDEAAELNERIRTGRVVRGEVDDAVTATGSDGLSIGPVTSSRPGRTIAAWGWRTGNSGSCSRSRATAPCMPARSAAGAGVPAPSPCPPDYVGEHAHLSYAATAYGVQGATVNDSRTILSEATSAASVYVGMTRGRETNRLHVAAEDMADARAQFIEAMERDPADRGLDHATQQAIGAVQGLVADGPVQLVTDELARLAREAERAEQAAQRWEQIAARFDAQRATHRAEDDESTAMLRKTEEAVKQVRAEVAQPLAVQAETDGAAYLAAVEGEATASARLLAAGRFGRRKARAEHRSTTGRTQALRGQVSSKWGTAPPNADRLPEWASSVAKRRAEADPRVADAAQAVETARTSRETVQDVTSRNTWRCWSASTG